MSDELFAPYSRSESIACGELVDASDAARMVGIGIPVAMTAAAWISLAADDAGARALVALRVALGLVSLDRVDRVAFALRDCRGAWQDAWAIIGPDDEGRPVLTILLGHETG